MAKKPAAKAAAVEELPPAMDYAQHNATYEGFIQMVKWGINIALVRDMTDAMYNPACAPYVNHDVGTQLVVGYIEKFWCPTIHSSDLVGT